LISSLACCPEARSFASPYATQKPFSESVSSPPRRVTLTRIDLVPGCTVATGLGLDAERAFLRLARKNMHRTGRPFLFGSLREGDWPIEAYEWSRATYVLLLDRLVGQRLYDIEQGTTEELMTLTGAIVIALEGLPSQFAC